MSSPARMFAYQVPSGYAGTEATVRIMTDWIAKRATGGDGSPADLEATERLRTRCRQIFADVPPLDDVGEIAAVWALLTRHVRYMADTLGTEHITDPAELDRQIDEGGAAEDCESIATYAATLFAVSGRVSQIAIMEKDPRKPGVFTHCALRVQTKRPKGWLWFDPVGYAYYPNTFTLGDTVSKPGELVELWTLDGEKAMRARYSEKTAMSAALGDAGDDALSILDAAAGIATTALGPYGALIGGAVKAGEGIAAAAGSKTAKATLTKDSKAATDKSAADKKKADEKKKSGGGITAWWDNLPGWQKALGGIGASLVVGAVVKKVL